MIAHRRPSARLASEWDGRKHRRPAEVGPNHHAAPTYPVQPDARRNTEDVRERHGRRDCGYLERGGMEHQDRRQREGEKGDLAPDCTDAGSRPHAHEVGVPPESLQRPDGFHGAPRSEETYGRKDSRKVSATRFARLMTHGRRGTS